MLLENPHLAKNVPDLQKFFVNGKYDFRSHEANIAFSQWVLKHNFGLLVDLDPSRLCPRISSRLAYIEWIKLLLMSFGPKDPKSIKGLDIGVGHSCIYPLLCMQYGWYMHGIDIDSNAIHLAQLNVNKNPSISSRITLEHTNGSFFKSLSDNICFTMCNPPFYESLAELMADQKSKKTRPFSSLKAIENELITQGGESAFLIKMIDESIQVPQSFSIWFTCLLGKKSSLDKGMKYLRSKKIYHTCTYIQPGKTRRWIIAWTFGLLKYERKNIFTDIEFVKVVLNDNGIEYTEVNNKSFNHSYKENHLFIAITSPSWTRKFRRNRNFQIDKHCFVISSTSIFWTYGACYNIWDSFSTWLIKQLSK